MTDYADLLRDAMSGLADDDGLMIAVVVAASVFEAIRSSAETYADTDPRLFATWMMTAAEAADGRDALAGAASSRPAAQASLPQLTLVQLESLARALTGLLAATGRRADDPADAAACELAASCATRILGLLTVDEP